jgi:HK97 family phage portal protein
MGKRQRRKLVQAATASAPSFALNDPRSATLFAPPVGGKIQVTESNALTISAVWAAVRVLSSAISVLPLHVMRGGEGRSTPRQRVFDSPSAKIAHRPCPEMGKAVFWELMMHHVLLSGNAYAEIERNQLGEPIALWPLPPYATRPQRNRDTREIEYVSRAVVNDARVQATIPAKNIFHLKGMGFDGLIGYSPIAMAARSLGITTGLESAQSSILDAGLKPGGWIEYPGSLQDFQASNLEEAVKKKSGVTNFGKALLMWGGSKFHPLEINLSDAQALESREFQVEEVARWFGLPPHKLQHLKRSTFNNIEHQSQEFVTDSLLTWLEKIADEFADKIVSEPDGEYVNHILEKLLRGDINTRYTAYGMGRQWGFLSPNEIREREDLPPMPGGDVFHVPVNMAPINTGATSVDALASAIVRRDLSEMVAIEQDDSDLLTVWIERATPADYGWVDDLARSYGHAAPRSLALAYGVARLAALRAGRFVPSIHDVTELVRLYVS